MLLLLLKLIGIGVGVLRPGVVGHEVRKMGPLIWRVVSRLGRCHDIWRRAHVSIGILCVIVVVVVVVVVVAAAIQSGCCLN